MLLILHLLLFALVKTVYCDCGALKEGQTQAITCEKYAVCRSGNLVHHSCPHGEYFDINRLVCYNSASSIPCSLVRDCTTKPDKRYADIETKCSTYYTCQNHIFHGHNFCNPGLIYDEAMQLCNWPHNVGGECGRLHAIG